jgi:hypothetical protein
MFTQKFIRTLKGIVIDINDTEAVVRFDEYEYEIPSKFLTENNINRPGQSFKMIETETITQEYKLCGDGIVKFKEYKLDKEHQEMLNKILKELK